jgi:hypothetical protein
VAEAAREHESTGRERPDRARHADRAGSASPGERLPSSTAAYFGARYGHDFSSVRVHADARAGAESAGLHARAFTVGSDIHFAPGRYDPHSADGQRLLAHELAHVVQQQGRPATGTTPDRSGEHAADDAAGRAIRGELARVDPCEVSGPQLQDESPAPTLGVRFNAAIRAGDWATAVRALEELPSSEAEAALAVLEPTALARLRTAALELDPAGVAPSSRAIDAALRGTSPAPRPAVTAPSPAVGDVARLSSTQKLGRAWDHASAEIAPALRHELQALFSPQSLVAMAAFAALFLAAQLTPAGWVADALALTVLTISILFVGMLVIDIVRDLVRFFGAINATSDDELRQAGSALARAIARGGVAIVIALLSKALPRRGPPGPTATAELVPAGAGNIRIPVRVQTIHQVPAAIPAHARYAAYAVMVPPGAAARATGPEPESTSSSRGGAPSRSPRGPEIWDEITGELSLEPPGTGARGGIRGAVQDAMAGGLVDTSGRPRTVDLAVQPHSTAPVVRDVLGTSGAQSNSAHIAPTSFVRGVPGYGRGRALTTGLDPTVHGLFDSWKAWARAQRRAGRTECTVGELYQQMIADIARIPETSMPQRTKNALAWRLEQEFRELGLTMDSTLELPYRNIRPD